MTIGERVLELVHDRGMTQKEFSEKTGIPQSTMSSWKGKKQNPSIDKLKVICDTLGVDPYYLISGSEGNESLNNDYVTVYRMDEEYEFLVEYRKMDRRSRDRLLGYVHALNEKLISDLAEAKLVNKGLTDHEEGNVVDGKEAINKLRDKQGI